MPNTTKEKLVQSLTDELKKSDQVIVTEYQGMKAEEFDAIRAKLKPIGAKYKVVKNRLAKIALKNVGWDALSSHLKGSSAIAYQANDAAQLAKVLSDYGTDNKKFKLKAGHVFGFVADEQGLKTIANLPSREVLLATLLARMNGPLSKFVATLNEPIRSLHGALSAVVKKKEANPA